MANEVVDAIAIGKNIRLEATIINYRSWVWRLKIGLFFIKLGARISGMGIEINDPGIYISDYVRDNDHKQLR